MKDLLRVLLIGLILYSCTNDTDDGSGDHAVNAKKAKDISSRDRSINSGNSYSDLFLDSLAMENFIMKRTIPDSIAIRMRSFYNTRNYQFAWFNSDGFTEEARAFWNLHDYVTTYDKDTSLKDRLLKKRMDALTAEDTLTVNAKDEKFIHTELTLTEHFIKYVSHYYQKGFVKRKEMERFIPVKKQDPLKLADSLINKKHKDDKYFEDVNPSYKALKAQLVKYDEVAKNGGWPVIHPVKKTLKKGMKDAAIPLIKKRLKLSGDYLGADTGKVYTDTLDWAVRNFQERHGYSSTGVISASLIKEMNVPVIKRLEQILMNMNRVRWMASDTERNMIVVNIPEFELHAYQGGQKLFDMDVVVGKEGHNTTMFNGDLNQVIFSPYWNVPQSIVENEILPEMDKHSDYLEKQDMEITGKDDEGLPVIRQKPGDKNALGKVKFLFPNSFNIYFHDTPAKDLFEKDKRAYSHGCIRLRDPEKMAEYVLRDQPEWTPEKIEEAMNSGKEKWVRVKSPVPVMITYYTAWVSENGQLNFREDIYGHDQTLAYKMFL